jgi:uncharacterized membrane protein
VQKLLEQVTNHIVLAIQAVAILVVVYGVAKAVFELIAVLAHGRVKTYDERSVWLTLARWLTAGLTFQLAADIVQTTVAPTWDEIGRLAAIAGIRTGLSYFLDRDIETVRARQRERSAAELRSA